MRNELIEQGDNYRRFDHSLAEKAAHYSDAGATLEALGLDSLMRASVVKGIELFTNFDSLNDHMTGEDE